ncbi:hypothetical protein AAFC00_000143 [Neodothiora populina]|uniref:Woronin body major protein n=1 Tax=Neodothiora populina TaxID=2781224 RepID=A0ABR3P2C4_9PEZI
MPPSYRASALTDEQQVPIPFSVFPSSYRSDTVNQSTELKVDEQVNLSTSRVGREGHETRSPSSQLPDPRQDHRFEEEVSVYEESAPRRSGRREERVSIHEEDRFTQPPRDNQSQSYRQPYQRYDNAQINVQDKTWDREYPTSHRPATHLESNIDAAERGYRQRTSPFADDYPTSRQQRQPPYPESFAARTEKSYAAPASASAPVTALPSAPATSSPAARNSFRAQIDTRTSVDPPRKRRGFMGYYDDEGHHHSIRHGLHRAADRILHPIHGADHHHHHHHLHQPHQPQHPQNLEDVPLEEHEITMSGSRPFAPAARYGGSSQNTITIPCHHIRIGDLLILQGRPCQVIRITTSAQTGQHRYLGVDLFTKQLNEESSFISNPSPSVVVQNMLGPVFKQYRVLDIRDDGQVVAMTETGDVKQGLPVLDQSNLLARLTESFDNGRGSVRVLVIDDDGRELAVDYKIVHGSRL